VNKDDKMSLVIIMTIQITCYIAGTLLLEIVFFLISTQWPSILSSYEATVSNHTVLIFQWI